MNITELTKEKLYDEIDPEKVYVELKGFQTIRFEEQVKGVVTNHGATDESLLAILIRRAELRRQPEDMMNAIVLMSLQTAKDALNERAFQREAALAEEA